MKSTPLSHPLIKLEFKSAFLNLWFIISSPKRFLRYFLTPLFSLPPNHEILILQTTVIAKCFCPPLPRINFHSLGRDVGQIGVHGLSQRLLEAHWLLAWLPSTLCTSGHRSSTRSLFTSPPAYPKTVLPEVRYWSTALPPIYVRNLGVTLDSPLSCSS